MGDPRSRTGGTTAPYQRQAICYFAALVQNLHGQENYNSQRNMTKNRYMPASSSSQPIRCA
jgi:hypothetical protein